MNKFFTVLALTTLIAAPAFSATKKKTTVKTATPVVVQTTPAYTTTHESSMKNEPELSGSFGLGSAASKFHFGVGFQVEFPTNLEGNHVRFGGQTGFYIGPSDPSTWIIPLLATGTYDFKVSSGTIFPYMGLGLGISITHYSVGIGGFNASGTNTDFAFIFRPGVNFGDHSKYFAEVPLGTIGNAFTVLPSFGVHF